jgi:hypothetical protein
MADREESAVLEVSSECKSTQLKKQDSKDTDIMSNYSTSLEGSVVIPVCSFHLFISVVKLPWYSGSFFHVVPVTFVFFISMWHQVHELIWLNCFTQTCFGSRTVLKGRI